MANTTGRDNLRVSAALPIAEQARVLLIEDDLSYAGYVQALFYMNDELDGELVVAHTLAAGVKHLREQGEFDAVLLDLNLPDSQGLDTLSWLLGQVPKANVIVLTGNEDRGQGVQAVAAGAQDFLVKNSALEAQLPRAICFSIQRKYFLQRLEEAQNLARIGNWEIRPDDNYFYASPAVYNFFQLDREEHTCSRYEELLQRDHCPLRLLLHHYEQAPEAEFYQENIEWQLDDGQSIYGLLNSHRSEQTSGMTIYTGTLQDVTLQKRAEELQRARDLAEETARVREQVLANVSHELRTPMNAILGMNNLLATMDLTAEQRECTDYIREASQVLLGIINDILLTSSLQQGTVELELAPFDLPLTIRRIVELIKPKADAKRLRLAYHLPEQWPGKVVGDKQRLSQVLFNIVGNAIKFTEQGAVNLRVQCQAGEQADELEVLIEVEDTGPGIAPEQQEQIFQPFVRLKQAKQNIEGTGLGLNIAQQLIQHMGGTITLCSQLGVGTTFKINLPLTLATEPKEEPPNTRPAPRELGLKRLLVVEDHPMNQIVIRRTLEKEFPQLDIQLADSGEAALELVAAHDFDLILMDLQLPGMDGYQTATNIRRIAAGAYAHIPILAMTAQAQVSHDERYQQAGIADYILKPFDPQDLFAKLTQYT